MGAAAYRQNGDAVPMATFSRKYCKENTLEKKIREPSGEGPIKKSGKKHSNCKNGDKPDTRAQCKAQCTATLSGSTVFYITLELCRYKGASPAYSKPPNSTPNP